MTEASPQIASNSLPPGRTQGAGSVGRAAGSQVKIVDNCGRFVEPFVRGEVAVRPQRNHVVCRTIQTAKAAPSSMAGCVQVMKVSSMRMDICTSQVV